MRYPETPLAYPCSGTGCWCSGGIAFADGAQPDQVVVILKAREPAGIMTAIGDKQKNKWHLETKQRWVDQYNFYLRDAQWGPMFVRCAPISPSRFASA